MNVYFIIPRLVVQKNDLMTTGIVYMPVGIATLVALYKENCPNIRVQVFDFFGTSPQTYEETPSTLIFGSDYQLLNEIKPNKNDIFLIYANQAANHSEIMNVINALKKMYPINSIGILENSQAVTAYQIESINMEFLKFDELKLYSGTPMNQFLQLTGIEVSLENLPTDSWDLFPLENYWNFKLAHGPQTSNRYLPYLSSYGCPWACTFCVVPSTNERNWASKSPTKVKNDLSILQKKYGVSEFHFEDLNSTVNEKRILEVADKIKDLKIAWKIVAGTKAETISSFESLNKLQQSGLQYLSISPESGSSEIRNEIGKRFNNEHAFSLTKWSNICKVKIQACFVLGMPAEKRIDRKKSLSLIRALTRSGVDEIAVFIVSPMPGAAIFKKYEKSVDLNRISFSPSWREDYVKLNWIRLYWYLNFLILKIIFRPLAVFKSIKNYIGKNFELKMEMAPYRALQWWKWAK